MKKNILICFKSKANPLALPVVGRGGGGREASTYPYSQETVKTYKKSEMGHSRIYIIVGRYKWFIGKQNKATILRKKP